MKNPLKPVSRAKVSTEAVLKEFGRGLAKKYKAAKIDYENSPRYKRAQERAAYEGAASSTVKERIAKKPKMQFAKPVAKAVKK